MGQDIKNSEIDLAKSGNDPLEKTKAEGEVLTPKSKHQRSERRDSNRRGFSLTRIIGSVAILFAIASVGSTFYASYKRDAEFSLATHIDRTATRLIGQRQLQDDEVSLVLRSHDGKLLKLVVEKNEADAFVNESIRELEKQRTHLKRQIEEDVDLIFDLAFSDVDEDVEKYADWFFEWKRSYIILKETLTSTATHIMEVGEVETINVAVERDLREYFMTHYETRILKPELRDPVITASFKKVAERAHERYRAIIAQNDLKLQLFLQKHTDHLQEVNLNGEEQAISIDWDAQRWKAPSYLMEDRAMDAVQGFGIIAASGVAGRVTLAPVIRVASARAISGLSSRFATALGTEVLFGSQGAVGGTAVNPGGGTIIGALVGVGVGLIVDYFVNEAQESIKRDDFVAANKKALEATRTLWEEKLNSGLHDAVDIWFDDTRVALVKSQSQI